MFSAASKSASGGTLQTVTFTSNTTWVAPTGVSVLRTMSGYGGAATADTFTSSLFVATNYAFQFDFASQPNPPFAQWADLYAEVTTNITTITGNTGVNYVSFSQAGVFVNSNDNWGDVGFNSSYWISSNTYTLTAVGSPSTSGNLTYASIGGAQAGWQLFTPGYALGNVGAATTGVSKTFPGGTLTGTEPYRTTVAAVTTNFTNVPVTPGVSYPIVVPSGGSLTITYIG